MGTNSLGVFIAVYIVWNIIVFAMFGVDKHKAKRGLWRVSERNLIFSALFMGGLGALFGMIFFHHKTKNTKFLVIIPLSLAINIAIAVFVVYRMYV